MNEELREQALESIKKIEDMLKRNDYEEIIEYINNRFENGEVEFHTGHYINKEYALDKFKDGEWQKDDFAYDLSVYAEIRELTSYGKAVLFVGAGADAKVGFYADGYQEVMSINSSLVENSDLYAFLQELSVPFQKNDNSSFYEEELIEYDFKVNYGYNSFREMVDNYIHSSSYADIQTFDVTTALKHVEESGWDLREGIVKLIEQGDYADSIRSDDELTGYKRVTRDMLEADIETFKDKLERVISSSEFEPVSEHFSISEDRLAHDFDVSDVDDELSKAFPAKPKNQMRL